MCLYNSSLSQHAHSPGQVHILHKPAHASPTTTCVIISLADGEASGARFLLYKIRVMRSTFFGFLGKFGENAHSKHCTQAWSRVCQSVSAAWVSLLFLSWPLFHAQSCRAGLSPAPLSCPKLRTGSLAPTLGPVQTGRQSTGPVATCDGRVGF